MLDRSSFKTRIGRFVPLQFKSMNLVVWPLGDPEYELADPGCSLEAATIHICPNRRAIDNLCSRNHCQFSEEDWQQGHFEEKLEQYQTAILAFSDGQFAHVIWAVVGDKAGKKFVWDPPVKLDWSQSAVLVGAYTPPAFRGKGLYPHAMYEGLRRLRSQGITNVFGAFHKTNIPSKRGLQKTNAFLAATCFRMRIGYHRFGVKYIPLLSYGARAGTGGRWYRRQFTDQIDIEPLPIV